MRNLTVMFVTAVCFFYQLLTTKLFQKLSINVHATKIRTRDKRTRKLNSKMFPCERALFARYAISELSS